MVSNCGMQWGVLGKYSQWNAGGSAPNTDQEPAQDNWGNEQCKGDSEPCKKGKQFV